MNTSRRMTHRPPTTDPDEHARKQARVKLYKIGEVMDFTGLSRQTIHNYTMLGLITEDARTRSGHRLYSEAVFERLERIQELKETMSLKDVRVALEEPDPTPRKRRS
ncbi:MAG: MerR family DNA-binding transcriptional regulator [Planctomycetota bacterium]